MKWSAIIILTILPQVYAHAVGFQLLSVPDKEHKENKDLAVGVWYPSNAVLLKAANSPFNQKLALNAQISVASAPLIILSHGYGGGMGSHADTALALAEAGFVVAAPSHTGNNYRDMSFAINQWIIERPKHVTAVIDYLDKHWEKRSVVKNNKVGVFGFSAGGQTVLSLIGAIPNFSAAKAHCDSNPKEYVCEQGMVQKILAAKMDRLPAKSWGADPRISAAVIVAPGLGIAYNQLGLTNVKVPVQLWSGLIDDRVPHLSNVKPIADALSDLSENHWIENAGHFSFLVQPCTAKLKEYEPKTWAFLCVDKEGFDRQAFHTDMNAQIVRFFKEKLRT